MEVMQYAPVLIPTLNRYEHLKRCIESLENCTGAEQTEVFVALDYPPSERYVEGWKRIDEFLHKKEKQNKFKKLHVIRRDHNYGVCHENANMESLLREVSDKFDCHIDSEDDNEFSPNFLEYMNKGLEKYKDDSKIMMISGYAYPNIVEMPFEANVIAYRKAAAWGAGFWTKKPFIYQIIGGANYRDSILKSLKKSMRLFIMCPISLNSLISMKMRNTVYGDNLMSDNLLLENKYCIFPKISKVRNWGHDGTGEHCGITDIYIKQRIDIGKTFDYEDLFFSSYIPNELNSNPTLVSLINKYIVFPIVIISRYLCFRLTGKDMYWFRFSKTR